MRRIVNAEQDALWNGEDGAHWADHHDRYDAMAEGFNSPLFQAAALTDTSQVLDIGCGTGHTTRLAARHARHGHAVGIDLSAPMLDRARGIAVDEEITNVTFIRGDAQVHSFPSGHFEVAISRAGVMFFADPVAAFTNIRNALQPGGRLVFVTHRGVSNRFQAVYAALAEHIPVPERPAQAPGVTTFTNPDHVRPLLADAGFEQVTVTPVAVLSVIGRDATDATDFLFEGALRPRLRHADPKRRAQARASVLRTLRADENDGMVRLPAHAWLYTATNPGR